MRQIINCIIFLFMATGDICAQNIEFNKVIFDEIHDFDKIYNDEVLMVLSDFVRYRNDNLPTREDYSNLFSITKLDTFEYDITSAKMKECLNDNFHFLKIYKISVKYNGHKNAINIPDINKDEFLNNTIEYYIIEYKNEYYKLFGFLLSDMLLFVDKVGKERLSCVGKILVDNNILKKRESKKLINALKNNRKYYPCGVNMPVQLLYYYYPAQPSKCNTILLPPKPFDSIVR